MDLGEEVLDALDDSPDAWYYEDNAIPDIERCTYAGDELDEDRVEFEDSIVDDISRNDMDADCFALERPVNDESESDGCYGTWEDDGDAPAQNSDRESLSDHGIDVWSGDDYRSGKEGEEGEGKTHPENLQNPNDTTVLAASLAIPTTESQQVDLEHTSDSNDHLLQTMFASLGIRFKLPICWKSILLDLVEDSAGHYVRKSIQDFAERVCSMPLNESEDPLDAFLERPKDAGWAKHDIQLE